MARISYFTVGSNDLEKAKVFYDALLGTIGMTGVHEHASGGRLYRGKGTGLFGVLGPYDGNAACVGNGMMGGFDFETREEVDVFHAKAMELGATDEGEPGERMPGAYFAYFRDLDGNKLCGYKFG
jgi:catechol 2,3-dioxygenase-like lactoylglutathione lyase family enzyme